jgi:hypothetical protein
MGAPVTSDAGGEALVRHLVEEGKAPSERFHNGKDSQMELVGEWIEETTSGRAGLERDRDRVVMLLAAITADRKNEMHRWAVR